MFAKVLIANRGEIAARIMRTLRRMGIASVAVHSDADRFAAPTLAADEAVHIGPSPASQSYLDIDAIVAACRATGAQAVHPGYGFLSERPAFAERLEAEGIRFIGPRPEHMRAFGLKHTARGIAQRSGVPLLPGSGLLDDADAASLAAAAIGFPLMLKSTAGGGGIGMQLCRSALELAAAFEAVQRLSGSNFGDARMYVETYVAAARHVEVQVFGDGRGGIVTLGERDCSLQRRHQKVIEETPAPGLSDATRTALHAAAASLCRSVSYESAGTVEFIYDATTAEFYFLEVNTRLQVEHPVTEAAFGIDLVEWMVRQAAGELALPPQHALASRGCAVEARIYAENPARGFVPSTGLLTQVRLSDTVRVDGWIETGSEVTPFYDPMLAKLIATGATRDAALDALAAALRDSAVWGVETNLDYLAHVIDAEPVRRGQMTTATLAGIDWQPASIDVLAPGTQSSVQDWPGRLGFWHVGVPPSGPMDARSLRRANALVANRTDAAALEATLTGPTLQFNAAATIALTGAPMAAALDGVPLARDAAVAVRAGQVLTLGAIEGYGMRSYLAVRGGIGAPRYLGARASFALGQFGGHATGALRTGDVLRIASDAPGETEPEAAVALTDEWDIGVRYGPHGAPDFFTESDIATLFATAYEVHFNSARTGVRLIGPKPDWARPDGGEAGLHPSNIHDNAYAVGAIDFTGDMPIILGPDGPSLGGFVCPAVIASDEIWKAGQLRPGDRVRFHRLDDADAVLRRDDGAAVAVCYRRAGDDNVLVEYGPPLLDIALRLRVALLQDALAAESVDGIIDLTPGIRSLQVHFDHARLPMARLLDILARLEASLPDSDDADIPSRIVHLPLSWDDAQARLAMQRYQELVRPDAPWCPSNIEFIRRINGLDSIDEVQRIVFDASYLVLGLGDVYLGAPVATPLDPRHRLVTTKYNPARTWTPENAVGIGGAYMCIYGMEGPGGYQLFGRTIQVWNSWRSTPPFEPGAPWLLRCFDQIRFFPVSEAELADARAAFPHGGYPVRIEPTRFAMHDHAAFLATHADAIAAFRERQRHAFDAERRDWAARALDRVEPDLGPTAADERALAADCIAIDAALTGMVWKLLVQPGDTVATGQPVAILESMKTEVRVVSPAAGEIHETLCAPGREVARGQRLFVLRRDGLPIA